MPIIERSYIPLRNGTVQVEIDRATGAMIYTATNGSSMLYMLDGSDPVELTIADYLDPAAHLTEAQAAQLARFNDATAAECGLDLDDFTTVEAF